MFPRTPSGIPSALTITNTSTTGDARDVEIIAGRHADGVAFTPNRLAIERVPKESSVEAMFSFDVDRTVAINAPDTMEFIIRDNQDGLWKKTIVVMYTPPQTFSLDQNYPNPFNPSTVIRYQLPVNSHVSLKVYDVLGREVMTLVDEVKAAGYYDAVFDAARLASGLYFYRIAASSYMAVKKMLVMK